MINSVHLHLVLVHIPIVLFPLVLVLLIISMLCRNDFLKRLSCYIMIFATAISIPAYLAGENAEDIVEKLPGVLESVIDEHSEAALYALWLSCVSAATALLTLFFSNRFKWINSVLIVLSLLTTLTLFKVGYEGGKIRHPEAYPPNAISTSESNDKDDD